MCELIQVVSLRVGEERRSPPQGGGGGDHYHKGEEREAIITTGPHDHRGEGCMGGIPNGERDSC